MSSAVFDGDGRAIRLDQATQLFDSGLAKKAFELIEGRRESTRKAGPGGDCAPLVGTSSSADATQYWLLLRSPTRGGFSDIATLVGTVTVGGHDETATPTDPYTPADLELVRDLVTGLREARVDPEVEAGR